MELIRIKLQSLIDQIQDTHPLISQYLSTYPYAQYKSLSAANAFKDKINEIVIFIASSISKSCKNGEECKSFEQEIKYTPKEVDVLCRIKAKLEDIRYQFVNISSNKTLHPSEIYSRLEEIYLFMENKNQNYQFKGVTRGRSFEVTLPQTPNKQQKQPQMFNIENRTNKKQSIIEESSQTAKKASYKLYKENVIKPIRLENQQNFLNNCYQAKKKIFSKGQPEKSKKKRFNYLQDFQKQQQRLAQQYRVLQERYQLPFKRQTPINELAIEQNQSPSKLIYPIELANLDDSLQLMKENQINTTAEFKTNITNNSIMLEYSFGQNEVNDQTK